MQREQARPTGRRKISLPQLQAATAGAVPFPPATPGRALAAFKRLKRRFDDRLTPRRLDVAA